MMAIFLVSMLVLSSSSNEKAPYVLGYGLQERTALVLASLFTFSS
jgi:hypothetical protein